MHVDGALNWSVDALGAKIMSSTPQGDLWPGCLTPGEGIGSNLMKCTDVALAKKFNKIFRRIAPPSGDPAVDVTDVEAKKILWRLEGALWTMGVFGGQVPSGLFHVRLPVANFSGIGETEALSTASILTIYGTGDYAWISGSAGDYKLDYRNDDEMRERLGVVRQGAWPSWPAVTEIPSWLHGSTTKVGFGLVETTNEAFGPTKIVDPSVGDVTGIAQPGLAKVVATFASKLAGIQCDTRFDGEPTKGVSSSSRWAEANAAFRTWKTDSWASPRVASSFSYDTGAPMELIRVSYAGGTTDPYPVPQIEPDHIQTGITHQMLLDQHSPSGLHQTSHWGPRRVSQWFVNSYPPTGTCSTASQLVQALAFACTLSTGEVHSGDMSKPPVVDSLDKLGVFQRWMALQAKTVRKQLSQVYLEDVPTSVVEAFTKKKPVEAGAGEHGIELTKLQGQLSQLARVGDSIAGDLEQIALAFDAANINIQVANVDLSIEAKELAVRRVGAYSHIAASVAKAASFTLLDAFGSKEYVEAAETAVETGFQLDILSKLDDIEALKKQKNALQIALTLVDLNRSASALFTSIRENLSNFRTQAADVRALLLQLKATEQKASYEAAKGAGEDFLRDSDGKVIASYPVNTVLRRQYDATDIRYKRALHDAKYLAYLARLSIEQRFGVHLSSITTRVGALDPPSKWADDVCSLNGVDYKKLRTAYDSNTLDGGVVAADAADQKAIGEFADAFIGDYLTKLENFVEFYNLEFPSHEGDDTAVISLKQDLLGRDAVCTKDAANLLYHSGDLSRFHGVTEAGVGVTRGWVKTTCGTTETKCLQVLSPGALSGGSLSSPASLHPGEEISWIRDVARSSDAGVADGAATADATPPSTSESAPRSAVWQRVRLVPGTYVLSWWDQARTATGAVIASGGTDAGVADGSASEDAPVTYRVAVLDQDFVVVAQQDVKPQQGDAWSARRILRASIPSAGVYQVAFWASADPSSLGSVAIAGTQLEWASKPDADPSTYVGTTSSRETFSNDCGEKANDVVQRAFQRKCDKDLNCFYELAAPFRIDTLGLDGNTSRLRGKLAAGNYNYRHVDVAMNLVGTGIRDCSRSPTSECYGSGYIEYSLDHDAFQTPILGWDGDTECFNFGSGAINHGKALAAERYITVPFSSADQGLLSQPAIEKQEFRGRPLDGNYRLRIWDSPALAWDRLEDVQIVLKYRYWSAVR